MLQSTKHMLGYHLDGTDGSIGAIHDFLFDDKQWVIRYAVGDTSRWLPGRKVLLSPEDCIKVDGEAKVMHVDLRRDQIKNSPDISTDAPVSLQEEERLREYYGWPGYWSAGFAPTVTPREPEERLMLDRQYDAEQGEGGVQAHHHLRSLREVGGYRINATDGDIGQAADIIVNDENWQLRYLVVDTRRWLPGRKVLLPLEWIRGISWSQLEVTVDVTRQAVKDSPEFNPKEPINWEYETKLYDYYGRPRRRVHAQ